MLKSVIAGGQRRTAQAAIFSDTNGGGIYGILSYNRL